MPSISFGNKQAKHEPSSSCVSLHIPRMTVTGPTLFRENAKGQDDLGSHSSLRRAEELSSRPGAEVKNGEAGTCMHEGQQAVKGVFLGKYILQRHFYS